MIQMCWCSDEGGGMAAFEGAWAVALLVIPFVAMGNAFSFGGVGGRTAADMVWIFDCERQAGQRGRFRLECIGFMFGFLGLRRRCLMAK